MRLSGTSPMMAVVCVSDRASLTGSPEDDSQAQSPVLHCHIFLPYLDVCVVFTALLSHYGSEGSRAAAGNSRAVWKQSYHRLSQL